MLLLLLPLLFVAPRLCFAAAPDQGPSPPQVAPFLKLRDSQLEYHGPDEDLPNSGEVRIGWFGPIDSTNQLAADMWCAAHLALAEANEGAALLQLSGPQSGSHLQNPLRYRLVPTWAADRWGTGVSQLARMVFEEQPVALIGSIDSAATHLAEQIVAKANLPLISPIATDKTATLAGVSWMFSCAPSDSVIAQVLVQGVLTALSQRNGRIALLTTTDHDSRMTAREVVRELRRQQRPPDFRFELPAGAHNTSGQLAALAEAAPEVVLIIAGAEDSARLVRSVRRLRSSGEPPLIFGSHSMGRRQYAAAAGELGDGVLFPVIAPSMANEPALSEFVRRFKAERGHAPDYTALLTYDATRLLLTAIAQAGPNRARVRTALTQLSPWPGIAGTITFDGTGQNTAKNVQLGTRRGGRIEPADLSLDSDASRTTHPQKQE
jgi:branched-chain amino acid transport system substrate-binding protein